MFQPAKDFLRLESTAGFLLLLSTLSAVILSNSPLREFYEFACHAQFRLGLGEFVYSESIVDVTNDVLMSIFFFVVGLEIKREFVLGEFASWRMAVLPVAAAVGGMVAPALIYFVLNGETAEASGWGVPMATDIAFSLGVMTLLGRRVPVQLKIFLTVFAIVDDLGAVLVIALFYGTTLHVMPLASAAVVFIVLVIENLGGVRSPFIYVFFGAILWLAILGSGIHPAIAGVIVAMTVPIRSRIPASDFVKEISTSLERFLTIMSESGKGVNSEKQAIVRTMTISCQDIEAPLHRMESTFHPWVSYGILPLFAFVNAGVVLSDQGISVIRSLSFLGIFLGLILGKQFGITVFSWLAVRSGVASLPPSLSWKHIYAVSWLGGIGFTMSIFMADLAFPDLRMLARAKTAIFAASLVAGCVGLLILSLSLGRKTKVTAE